MPELPEVETVARQLAPLVVGRRVRAVHILDEKLADTNGGALRGRRVRDVRRLGKQVLFEFAPRGRKGAPRWLLVHLRMTGRLIWDRNGHADAARHLRARITFDRGALLFIDSRRFGTMCVYRRLADAAPAGAEPLAEDFTARLLADLLAGSRQNIKAWLLRQDRLVGLGNIYASEILHAARISPFRQAGSLDRAEVGRLYSATRRILCRAIRHCGTTFSDFRDADGRMGDYRKYLAVFARAGAPCRRCRTPVERIVQNGRSTFYCPTCSG